MQDRACLFGEVVDGEMRVNDAGWMVARWWTELVHASAAVETDAYVVMPNHMHGIIVIHAGHHLVGADLRVGPNRSRGQGRTPRCAPTSDRAMVQNYDDERIHLWRQNLGLVTA